MVGRRGIDDEIGVAHRIAMVGRGAQARAERKPSEESTILVCVVDRARDVGLERPQYRVEAVAGEQIGESGSPRTGADDPATHQANLAAIRTASTITRLIASVAVGRLAAVPALPNRCSSPLRNRTMFARCVQKTNSATTRLIANSGERTPTVTPSRIGRTVALVSEPSETNPLESSTTAKINRAR